MDALLTALLGCFLGEIGDKNQLLLIGLATRFSRKRVLAAGAVLAAIANAAVGAGAAAFVIPMLGSDARLLFLALSILFLGLGMFWPVKAPDPLSGWRTGPFLTAALGVFILGFGDGSQFLVLGIATRTADPVMAGIGGAVGMVAAFLPAIWLRETLTRRFPVRAIRLGGGVVMLLIAFSLSTVALNLV